MSALAVAIVCSIEALLLAYLLFQVTNLPRLPASADWSRIGFWPSVLNGVVLCAMFIGILMVVFSIPMRRSLPVLPPSVLPYALGLLDVAFAALLWLRLRYDHKIRGLN